MLIDFLSLEEFLRCSDKELKELHRNETGSDEWKSCFIELRSSRRIPRKLKKALIKKIKRFNDLKKDAV